MTIYASFAGGLIAIMLSACVSGSTATSELDDAARAQAETKTAEASEAPKEKLVAAYPLAGDPDQMICKHEPITGSRVKTKKICMTRGEWQELSDQTQRSIDNGYTRPPEQ